MLTDFFTILSFCRAQLNKSRRLILVRLVRLNSAIELTEKFQFDYVGLPKQLNNNPTDYVRLIFGSISFDKLRRANAIS